MSKAMKAAWLTVPDFKGSLQRCREKPDLTFTVALDRFSSETSEASEPNSVSDQKSISRSQLIYVYI